MCLLIGHWWQIIGFLAIAALAGWSYWCCNLIIDEEHAPVFRHRPNWLRIASAITLAVILSAAALGVLMLLCDHLVKNHLS